MRHLRGVGLGALGLVIMAADLGALQGARTRGRRGDRRGPGAAPYERPGHAARLGDDHPAVRTGGRLDGTAAVAERARGLRVQPADRRRRVAARRLRRSALGPPDDPAAPRRGRRPALDHPEPDRALDRHRPAGPALGLPAGVRRVQLGELVLGRGDRRLPRVLPGGRRHASRPQVAGRHPPRPDADVRGRLGPQPAAPATAGQRAVPAAGAATRRRRGGHRGRGGRGVDRTARRHRSVDHRVRPGGRRRPGQAVGPDLRIDRHRAAGRRIRGADRAHASAATAEPRCRRECPFDRRRERSGGVRTRRHQDIHLEERRPGHRPRRRRPHGGARESSCR